MSERAREFLEHWSLVRVGVVREEFSMRETVRLVGRCRDDAVSAGVAPDELRTAAGGNLMRCVLAQQGESAISH
jgi:hypothetical protein